MANTLAEVKPKTFSDKLPDVKARKLDETRYYAKWRPSKWSDAGIKATIRHKSS